MSTSIRVDCPICGATEVSSDRARLVVSPDGGPSVVAFTCPTCQREGQAEVTARGTRLLLGVGISVVIGVGDGEPPHGDTHPRATVVSPAGGASAHQPGRNQTGPGEQNDDGGYRGPSPRR